MDWNATKVICRGGPYEPACQPSSTEMLPTVRNVGGLRNTDEYTAIGTPSCMPLEQAEGRVLGPNAERPDHRSTAKAESHTAQLADQRIGQLRSDLLVTGG